MSAKDLIPEQYDSLIILGPTAVGKTSVAVNVANELESHVISADSRQVYKKLNIGSGKDLDEYTLKDGTQIPYHLIDMVSLPEEYSVYNYQKDFYKVYLSLKKQNIKPVICGGTGMYLDAIIRNYKLNTVPMNHELRESFNGKSLEELQQILLSSGLKLHNETDLLERHRLIRAIEIQEYSQQNKKTFLTESLSQSIKINPIIFGTTLPRAMLRENITQRLIARLKEGMIDEVKEIHDSGIEWERLERLGLEYRYVSFYLQQKIKTEKELFSLLNTAIHQFAKRQETWFRGMENKGITINWIPYEFYHPETETYTEYRTKYIVNFLKKLCE